MGETAAVQDYLKAIHQLGGMGEGVATSELAERLGVRPASVSSMLRRLDAEGLVRHERYQGVRLTRRGERMAVETIRHHRLLELYLNQMVGMSWDRVHEEADRLEHVISEELESRLDELLGYPTEDPHGHPIPTADLVLEQQEHPTLCDARPGDVLVVRSVSDEDPELLRHLGELGLRPGAEVHVEDVVPFGGAVRVRIDGRKRLVGAEAARVVSVRTRQVKS